ncbi:chemotaxis protein [Vibrio sp. S4M6]|uniref:chemotaxis protein n=1 Tax=Vibrio sinus TaxID=2946865 RepID=UPI002029D73B|nr:chemotaxis protein [Vibrio sinus]MCL9782088.1 chemotaxis protein [Vibrio sinus]
MGGKSSSSNTTQSTNVSGQTAISGDNLGTAISGVNNSTVNVTATDHGAVKHAFELGGELVEQSGEMFEQALEHANQVNVNSMDFAENALEDISSSHSENLQVMAGLAGNQAEQNTKNLDALMDLAKFNQDGGASENKQQQVIMMVVISVVLGGVAIMAVKR